MLLLTLGPCCYGRSDVHHVNSGNSSTTSVVGDEHAPPAPQQPAGSVKRAAAVALPMSLSGRLTAVIQDSEGTAAVIGHDAGSRVTGSEVGRGTKRRATAV